MIGRRIESRWRWPWGVLLWLSIGVALLAGGLVLGRPPLSIASALPISIGLASWMLGRERSFVAEFAEESIEIEDPQSSIPYSGIRDLRAGWIPHDPSTFRKASAPIHLEHDRGVLHIPANLSVPSHEVYRFLAGRMTSDGDRAVNPALAEYLERQEGYYGPEHIWTYRAASRGKFRGRYRRFRAFCAGLVLGGAVWMVLGFSGRVEEAWGVAGIMCALLGFLFFLVTLAELNHTGRFIKGWKGSSLVIGPQGMAMVQGDIQGEVRWPELLEIRLKPKPSKFYVHHAQAHNGILLKVKGADILIADIYDRPLYIIYDRIMASSGRLARDEVDL